MPNPSTIRFTLDVLKVTTHEQEFDSLPQLEVVQEEDLQLQSLQLHGQLHDEQQQPSQFPAIS